MLTLAQAQAAVQGAHIHAGQAGMAPLCVVALDGGGHVLAIQRHEQASLYRIDIATAKAHGCIGMGMGGREIARRAAAMPNLYAVFNEVSPGGLVPVPGGVLIKDQDGAIIGAIGISGDTADNDEAAALAGLAAAGLIADTGVSG